MLSADACNSEQASALVDLEQLIQISPNDIPARALRASTRARRGELKLAQSDVEHCNCMIAANQAWRSPLGDADCDLEFIARGWAYMGVSRYTAATSPVALTGLDSSWIMQLPWPLSRTPARSEATLIRTLFASLALAPKAVRRTD